MRDRSWEREDQVRDTLGPAAVTPDVLYQKLTQFNCTVEPQNIYYKGLQITMGSIVQYALLSRVLTTCLIHVTMHYTLK